MQGKVPAIYDIELVFKKDDPVKPTIRNMLFGKPVVAHMYMKRINMESVPSGEDAQDLFLREMFQDKVSSITSCVVVVILKYYK